MTTAIAPPRTNWRLSASCIGQADLFFPSKDRRDDIEAKRICRECPVRQECLTAALAEEGAVSQWERYGTRGGMSPRERALAAGAPASKMTPADPHDYAEADVLLRSGTMSDAQISKATGIPDSSIHRRREALGLPVFWQRATPQSAFEAHARSVDGGHVVWESAGGGKRPQIKVQKQYYRVTHLAFLLGYGREAEGHVKVTCGFPECIAWEHLADRVIRNSRVAA
ncbi:WhiB family transcriptional regulator [Streptomyces sp. A0592]|uniref:WhiB family transcriptional regulator n=1 Tax=Streptomyces sp. A0592 TaxID=2563099 RepID=UPI00109E7631|nr:WhiB family transcriptional regulator [Streptomyces sp. A0592]THA82766.1 hypothetical protein E6U81_19685 [Streptomyces sp. A0592]